MGEGGELGVPENVFHGEKLFWVKYLWGDHYKWQV